MKRARDSQRSKVYRAERAAFLGENDFPSAHHRYPTVDELKRRCNSILHSKTVCKILGRKPTIGVGVDDGRGRRPGSAAADAFNISFTRDSRVEWILLHEMAHVIHRRLAGTHVQAWHGHEFCAIYLKLVRRFIGKEAHDALRACFKKYRVRYTPPRKLSPERLAQLREHGRLLAASINNTGETK